ncbi:hypothetical protein FQ154_14070 [Paeniglutamicibacter gangotriensis]|uniref:PQQ-binding-like beta-propeller repeat protein n=1 Tax=Paeniglutamicibacter gangotriensis TaxID=254787 RepID=A0A5B0ECA8_9MICC|nr:PQQ-binding-like beta-propeller repeat protein [Paeniglutamicibacter gangotriensis]KAA0975320.1 hypothetical protein FQ154_14070 [Paeniglutamicibacter gangotriensis]
MRDLEVSEHFSRAALATAFSQKLTSRRRFFGIGLSTAAVLVAGCSNNTQPDNVSARTSPPVQAQPTKAISWPKTIKDLKAKPGLIKKFNDVFTMTSISRVSLLEGKDGSRRLAICMYGNSHQIQLIDPMSGSSEKVITLPHHLIARGMAWDSIGRTLYIGATNGHIFAYDYDSEKIVDIGPPTPSAGSLYGLTFDSTGRLWGGSYPRGIIWNYTPKTKKFVRLPRIDADMEYVYSLAITADDRVYAGTGTNSPKVVCFPAASPNKRTVLNLPDLPKTGFVSQITVSGDLVLIHATSVKTHLIWNHKTKKLTTAALPMDERISSGPRQTGPNFWLNQGSLYSTDSTTGKDTKVGPLNVDSPEQIWVADGNVFVLSRTGAAATTHRFDLETKTSTVQSTTQLSPAGVEVRSLLAHSNGKIYIGGFLGQGIATLDPATNKRWQSPDNVAPNQISGMIQWDEGKIFIGSYGSADIIRFDTSRAVDGPNAFKLMERLGDKYDQSRAIGWAKNENRVFFGTVPDYGLTGGAMGIIDPVTDTIEHVYNKLIPGHSIVGLAANAEFVYGTTSTRNGMGIPNTDGDAKVFAFDLAKKKVAWSRKIPGHGAAMSPQLVDDKILAATIEGIVVLRASDGVLIHDHAFTGASTADKRPGWLDANLKRFGDSYRFMHCAEGIVYAVDFLNGTGHRISDAGQTGTAMAVTDDGRVFISHDVDGIAEISPGPRSKS